MLKIKASRLWVLSILITLSYPLSVLAATNIAPDPNALVAPFLFSWLGVWVFAAAGGLCAGFVKIDDIDERLHRPVLAKFVIGLFWGVALPLVIDAFTSTPQAALTFFALFASCFSAPICAGLMVYLSNQKRLNSAFDQVARRKGGVELSGIEDSGYYTRGGYISVERDYSVDDGKEDLKDDNNSDII